MLVIDVALCCNGFSRIMNSLSFKKRIPIALSIVVLGHMGALWALNHVQIQETKPPHKESIKVKVVKIVEPAKPTPPKPKPEPKKEVKQVKIVPKQPPPPTPKKVEKVQQVKKVETPKHVEHVEKPQPLPKVTLPPTPKVMTQPTPEPAPKIQPMPQPAPKAAPKPVVEAAAPAVDNKTPKKVSIGGSGINWSRSPDVNYDDTDLKGSPRSITVTIEANEKGKVTNVKVIKSSGIPALDEKVVRAVCAAKFTPYKENGIAYPIRGAEQSFDLT